MKVALATLVRNENRYLKEWIDHYMSLGIDHIFIGDNNDIETGEDVLGLIKNIGYEQYATVIDVRKSSIDTTFTQNKFFTDTYNNVKNEYDYIAFFDVDEFLWFSNDWSSSNNIKEYIDNTNKKVHSFYNVTNVEQIRVGWITYGDNDQLFYEDKPVQERFKYPSSKIYKYDPHNNVCGKTILKCNTNHNFVFNNSHIAISDASDKVCTAFNGGNDHNYNMKDPCTYFIHIDSVLRHYVTKSTEEFFFRKMNDRKSYIHKLYDEDPISYWTNYYFTINERTPQKERFLEYLTKCKF